MKKTASFCCKFHPILTLTVILFTQMLNSPAEAQDYEKYKANSMFTDYKAMAVGDIVTIMISESTSGSQTSNMSQSGKGSIKASGGLSGNLTKFLPQIEAETDFQNNDSGKASSAQQDALSGKVTAIVMQITRAGNLILKGKKKIDVNGAAHLLRIEGTARQKDISSDNVVMSFNLANVSISYKKDGDRARFTKPSFIARWMNWFLVGGLAVSGIFVIGVAGN